MDLCSADRSPPLSIHIVLREHLENSGVYLCSPGWYFIVIFVFYIIVFFAAGTFDLCRYGFYYRWPEGNVVFKCVA